MTSLGFIGTGNLAAFFVEGLARAGAKYRIIVSERSKTTSAELARRFGVAVSSDSQEIVDRSELVVVSVLPQQAEEAVSGLRFRKGQSVLSVMAGVPLWRWRNLVAPADAAVSMMPGLANAHNAGPSALYPDEPKSRALLERLGPLHVYADEPSFTTASALGAFSGLSVLMMRDAAGWFEHNGLGEKEARQLVAETLLGNARMLIESPLALDEVARGVVTPGGITEQGRKLLDGGKSWGEALDAVRLRLARG